MYMVQEAVRHRSVRPSLTVETPYMLVQHGTMQQFSLHEFELWRGREPSDLYTRIKDFSKSGSWFSNRRSSKNEYRTLAERERASGGAKEARRAYDYYTTIYEIGMVDTDKGYLFCEKMRAAHLAYLLKHAPRPSFVADYVTLHTGFDAMVHR